MSRDFTIHIGAGQVCPLVGHVEKPSFDAMVNPGEKPGDEPRIGIWVNQGDTKKGLYFTMALSQYEAMNAVAQKAIAGFAK